jgi:hypothetical protein
MSVIILLCSCYDNQTIITTINKKEKKEINKCYVIFKKQKLSKDA